MAEHLAWHWKNDRWRLPFRAPGQKVVGLEVANARPMREGGVSWAMTANPYVPGVVAGEGEVASFEEAAAIVAGYYKDIDIP